MLKKIIITLVTLILIILSNLQVLAIDLSAKSSILMETENKEIVLENNAQTQMPMASTTKIMTSLLALEAGIPNYEVVVTEEMLKVEGTSMGLLSGDIVSIKNLVYGMLLESGNDAANVVAYKLGGGQKGFSKIMNKRAQQIGMKNTNFVTPSGLDEEGHCSTAYDMALLGIEAIKNPEFRVACGKENVRVSYGNPPYMRTLTNHNSLLKRYPYAIGIKTGFTKKSRRCLVSAAEKDGIVLVAVTLNASNDWDDHIKMYEYGFNQYKNVDLDGDISSYLLNVVGANKKKVKLMLSQAPKAVLHTDNNCEITRVIKLPKFEYAPLQKGKVVGKSQYYCEDKLICEVPIVVGEDLKSNTQVKNHEKKSFLKRLIDKIKG